MPARLPILIVGGGASGVLLAAHLLRRGRDRAAVTIVELRAMLGCGVAYSTSDDAHLLNTRVANMSAYGDEPAHFADWLRAQGGPEAGAGPDGFVTRATYGRYMGSLLHPWQGAPVLACRHAECVGLDVGRDGVVARLADGGAIGADLAVLATGHALPDGGAADALSQPWAGPVTPCDGTVLIVGSGLTMVDQALSLLAAGHRGPIVAASRRGLLPQPHGPSDPVRWDASELPPATGIAPLMRWLRAEARARVAAGGDWRDVVDGLRPHIQGLWRALPLGSRRTFLRHAAPWWEAHRHRMPPSSHARVTAALAEGRLRLLRGRFDGVRPEGGARGRLLARIALPRGRALDLPAARVVDCRGIRRDPEAHATPLVADLLAQGEARVDPLRIGLDVDEGAAVFRRDGTVGGRLYAIGPASRAAFWEVTAIPDIRAQAAGLAERLLALADG